MNDAELFERAKVARGLAHRAPLQECSMDHRGHWTVVRRSSAYALRTDDLFALWIELKHRGLDFPACDCPADAHEASRKRLNRS